jgi:hypothetical protein
MGVERVVEDQEQRRGMQTTTAPALFQGSESQQCRPIRSVMWQSLTGLDERTWGARAALGGRAELSFLVICDGIN